MNRTQTIAARLTPDLPAAIATIAVRGPQAAEYVSELASFRGTALELGQVRYGTWGLNSLAFAVPDDGSGAGTQRATDAGNDEYEEQVVICRTGPQQIEIHCHGGSAVCDAILKSLATRGCEVVSAREWPSEATCPIKRAAELDLVHVVTDKAARVLLDQYNGALSEQVGRIAGMIESGDQDSATSQLRELLSWAALGLHLAQPFQVVLAGPPNVGKSSLLNALSGQSRSIVHAEAGTTRDWIESPEAFHGWPVSITDTAGLRVSTNEIEAEGVRRAEERIAHSDLLVMVVDATQGWTQTHAELAAADVTRKLIAINKIDLLDCPQRLEAMELKQVPGEFSRIATSATVPDTSELIDAITSVLIPREPSAGTALPFRVSQVQDLQRSLESLEKNEPQQAIETLRKMLAPWSGRGEAS